MIWLGPGRCRWASPRRENPGHLAFLQPCSAAPIKSMSVGPLSCSRHLHSPSPSQVPPGRLPTRFPHPWRSTWPPAQPCTKGCIHAPPAPQEDDRQACTATLATVGRGGGGRGPSGSPLTPTAGGESGISLMLMSNRSQNTHTHPKPSVPRACCCPRGDDLSVSTQQSQVHNCKRWSDASQNYHLPGITDSPRKELWNMKLNLAGDKSGNNV